MDEMTEPKKHVTVSTKLPFAEAVGLKLHLNRAGSNPSEFIRQAILEKLNSSHVSNIAGKNKIEYNPRTNSFIWKVELDDGEEHIILEHLSLEFLQDLQQQLSFEINKRAESLSMKKKGSVPVPRRLVK